MSVDKDNNIITPSQYEALSDDEKFFYDPEQ